MKKLIYILILNVLCCLCVISSVANTSVHSKRLLIDYSPLTYTKILKAKKWKASELKNELRYILNKYDIYSESLLNLLLGTAIIESDRGRQLKQVPYGPARGIFQIEKSTATDAWRYINRKVSNTHIIYLRNILNTAVWKNVDLNFQLKHNLEYQVILAIIVYRMHGYTPNQYLSNKYEYAKTWKKRWNTHLGKGTTKHFILKWNKAYGIKTSNRS